MTAIVLLAAGLAGWSSASQWAAALLGALLLLRHRDRLLLAPLYGAGLLLIVELAHRSRELRGVRHLTPGTNGSRLAALVAAAGLGAGAAALAAGAVTIAPGRSVAFTAAGALAALAAGAAIVVLARRGRAQDR